MNSSATFFSNILHRHANTIFTSVVLGLAASPAVAADIVDTVSASGSFKTFVAAMKTAGFSESLKSPGPYTVFVPTDAAIAKLPAGTWEALLKDKVKLTQMLAYHVIPGKVLVAEVKPGKVKTVEGESLEISSDNGKVTVNHANVVQSDLVADNGVIHAIDRVVLP